MVEDGSIHPPVAMNLFVVQAQAPRCQDHQHPSRHHSLSHSAADADRVLVSQPRRLLDVFHARQCGVVARLEAWPDPALNDGSPLFITTLDWPLTALVAPKTPLATTDEPSPSSQSTSRRTTTSAPRSKPRALPSTRCWLGASSLGRPQSYAHHSVEPA
jgi:hypothetical protein